MLIGLLAHWASSATKKQAPMTGVLTLHGLPRNPALSPMRRFVIERMPRS
jgi:hypothetical protein